jgi:hypothetical protein
MQITLSERRLKMAKRFFFVGAGILVMVTCSLVFGLNYSVGNNLVMQNLSPAPPANPVRLIFIHHSTGENWLSGDDDGLGKALEDNNYYVSDTNYGWGPDSIGDRTDIGNWWDWFRGPERATYLSALYDESGQNCSYSRLLTAPSGENEIIMFKSCFPNSALQGNPNDPVPSIDNNPLKGEGSGSENHTVANAKGIYIDLLEYFRTRQDKLFIVITAPPLSDSTYADNARAFNNWLVNEWLNNYSHNNVFVFDFYNVLTSNGGNSHTNDLNRETGNHHRWWNNTIQHKTDGGSNVSKYPSSHDDDHPSQAGNLKATGEFLDLLNIAYNRWKGEAPPPSGETVSVPSILFGPTSGTAGIAYTYSTGGAISSLGHSVQYLFYWGDGTNSGWLPVGQTSASKSWDCSGTYTVTGLARCATNTSVVSGLSSGLSVNISGCTEAVSTPNPPTGPDSGIIDTDYSFTADGATSSLGHPIEYRFDWGDGTFSDWLPVGTTIASKSWSTANNYPIALQARCATDTDVVSNWSETLSVNITSNPTLTVLKSGTGDGTVTSSPGGINCGDDCSEVYNPGTKVRLTAKADTNSTFTGWSSGGCSGTGKCIVTMDTDTSVTATFSAKVPDISVPQTTLDFGNVKVGKKKTKTLKIMNSGTGDLVITLLGLEGTGFSIQGSSSVTIKGKKSYSLKVLFMPTSSGLEAATLMMSSNDPDTPILEISLSGTGQ